MAFLKLKSENPNLSYIIKKNPSNPMFISNLRKGMLFGWYSPKDTFNVWFKEGENQISFPNSENPDFEYINVSRYSSPTFITETLNEFFRATVTKEATEEDTEEFENTLEIAMVNVRLKRYFNFFKRSFPEMSIEEEEVGVNTYKVKFSTKKSLHYLLNIVNLFCLFSIILGDDFIRLETSLVNRYLRSLNEVKAPYHMRYLFKRNVLKSRKGFAEEKILLEQSDLYDSIELQFGDTLTNRVDKIKSLLTFERDIVDIGCGEGNYARLLAPKVDNYYLIDTDEQAMEKAIHRCKKKDITNVFIVDEDNQPEREHDVLLTEVIEHNPKSVAFSMVVNILKEEKVKNLIITTPCRDFNQFYHMEEEFRHEGHVFEFTLEEWEEFLENVETHSGLKCEKFEIGDKVNGIPTSVGAIFRKDQ